MAKKLLKRLFPDLEILAYVVAIHHIESSVNPETVTFEEVEANAVRCPDAAAAEAMVERIKQARSEGDSVGGVIECVVRGGPPGLGEPVFDKLEADLAKAMLSLPATKGFEIGSGFAELVSKVQSTMMHFGWKAAVFAQRRTSQGGSRGESAMASPWFFGSLSSPPPRLPSRSKR